MITSKIASLLNDGKFTKVALAKKCNVTRVTIDNLLSGADVKVSTVEAVARAYDVPVGYFFDEEPVLSGHSAHVKGNNNVLVGGSNHGTINKLNECEREVEILRVEVKHLTSQVEEKERLIQVLMKNQ